ncbi:hypothetical protein AVEN_201284-1, partial [Araneus ventricosus]
MCRRVTSDSTCPITALQSYNGALLEYRMPICFRIHYTPVCERVRKELTAIRK